MIKGKLIGLVAVERQDIKQLCDWRNNTEFRKYFREYRELSMANQEEWYENKVLKDPTTMMLSIRRLSDNVLIGVCGFVYINCVHRHADLSLYIGWNNEYIDEQGYAEDTCRELLRYGFNELSLNKVWTEIYDFDSKKKNLYDQMGFKQDGLLRQNYFHNGKWWGSRIMSILCNEFKY